MDVAVWLGSLGLGKYEAAFRENEIDQNGPPEPDGSKERATGFRDNNERVVKEIDELQNS